MPSTYTNNHQTIYHTATARDMIHPVAKRAGTRKNQPPSWRLITYRQHCAPAFVWSKVTGIKMDKINAAIAVNPSITPEELLSEEAWGRNDFRKAIGAMPLVGQGSNPKVYTFSRETWAFLIGMTVTGMAKQMTTKPAQHMVDKLALKLHESWWTPLAVLRACKLKQPTRLGVDQHTGPIPTPAGMEIIERLWNDARCPKHMPLDVTWTPDNKMTLSEIAKVLDEDGGDNMQRTMRQPNGVTACLQRVMESERDMARYTDTLNAAREQHRDLLDKLQEAIKRQPT